jgi:hypothetical protein
MFDPILLVLMSKGHDRNPLATNRYRYHRRTDWLWLSLHESVSHS